MNLRIKQFIIRLSHWEYWPFHVVYFPVYFYWFWLMLKSRSFFFFNTANPLIHNGGFLMESKKQIYDLMPRELYPKTILIEAESSPDSLLSRIIENNLKFPLVAKPDIGMRGLRVAVVKNTGELLDYLVKSSVDFLVQEYIGYEQEIGIFYYRIPGEIKGMISGVVGKEFLSVTGDGHSTVEQLVVKNDRALLQWRTLQKHDGAVIQKILPAGMKLLLVPFGNHSRGAKFLDLTHLVDEKLTTTIDRICKTIPGFYYGRIDVRFNSWKELREGKSFSIIELNGAGSEPTHIYDPKHSIFFAWCEIIRHLDLLFKISRLNKRRKNLSYMTMAEGWAMLKANRKHLALIPACGKP